MKTLNLSLCCLTAILLGGLITSTLAQDDEQWKNNLKKSYSASLNLNSTLGVAEWLNRDDVREGLGVSKEQYQKMDDVLHKLPIVVRNDPICKSLQEEMVKLRMESNFDIQNASEEIRKRYFDLEKQHNERTQNLVDEKFTPDQMKKIKEFQISMMSEGGLPTPSMFEALDLSDEQKWQLDEIKKELEPEFDNFLDNNVEFIMKVSKKEGDFNKTLEGDLGSKENQKLRSKFYQKLWVELRSESDKIRESSKEFMDKLKIEMFDVLTDEQWDRMIDLIDNPPDYVKKVIAQMRKWKEERDSKNNSDPAVWVPGPNSWQPGDPIPEAYRQERKTRGTFPRPKQPSP